MSFPSRFYINRGGERRSRESGDFISCSDAAAAIRKFSEENFAGILSVTATVEPSAQGFLSNAASLAKMICRIARLANGEDVVNLEIYRDGGFFVFRVRSKAFEGYGNSYDVELIRMANEANLVTYPRSDGIEFRIAITRRGVGVVRAISVSVLFAYLTSALRDYENDDTDDV